jgi:hypothetical protein
LDSLYQGHIYLFKRTRFGKVGSPPETRVHHGVIFNEFTKAGLRQGYGSLSIMSISHRLVTLHAALKVKNIQYKERHYTCRNNLIFHVAQKKWKENEVLEYLLKNKQ